MKISIKGGKLLKSSLSFVSINTIKLVAFFCLITLSSKSASLSKVSEGEAAISREKINFDFDWKFLKGDYPNASNKVYDDKNWETLDVPHDWSIKGPFLKENPSGNTGAYAPNGFGWYRKTFNLKNSDVKAKISIEFGGVYMNSEVWINGHYLGKRPYGYISFNYDLTPYLNFKGENVISVRVDNSKEPSARWFTGSGIYRHVYLIKTNKLHVARHGVYATAKTTNKALAKIEVKTIIDNDDNTSKDFVLINELYNAKNVLVGKWENTTKADGNKSKEISQSISLNNPILWSPENPYLYVLKTKVKFQNQIIDEIKTNVGVRDIKFSATTGFSLNGVVTKLKGVNDHSDLGALGAAINDRALERRLEILKAMGCNAIRTAHNPPCEELLDLCDKMGFMVMDEAFDEWIESWPFGNKKQEGKAPFGYHLYFNEWAEKDLTEMIKRDRNHPSIVLWSVGNEIPDACFPIGTERLAKLMGVVKALDTTRSITCGIPYMHLANATGFASLLDVTGYNGGGGSAFMFESDHEKYPERKMVATEVPHSFQTRGEYSTKSWVRDKNPAGGIIKVPDLTEEEVFTNGSKYYSSSYDNSMVRINARDSWKRTKEFDYMAGEFRWTGFDYLGESMFGWPARLWNFGVIDMCGFPKDTYYFYQSQWTDKPMVHILPHWNLEGKEGTLIPVVAYSNCDAVELFLNGVSLGEKSMKDQMNVLWNVPYKPGKLEAKAKINGKVMSTTSIVTSGKPDKMQLLADRKTIDADGRDVVHIEVNIQDKDGNFVPYANNLIKFKIDGAATIIAVDNGDPSSEESFVADYRKAFNGKCLLIVKAPKNKGKFTIYANADGLPQSAVVINAK